MPDNGTLHHSLSTTTLMNKQRSGYKLRDSEMRQLTEALHNENEMQRTGGRTDNALPRATNPADAYASGYGSMQPQRPATVSPRALFNNGRLSVARTDIPGTTNYVSPEMMVPAQPRSPTPVTPVSPSAARPNRPTIQMMPRANAISAQAPVTPPAREQNNPMTGDTPNIPQGGRQDMSIAAPSGVGAGMRPPLQRTTAPASFYGGMGQYRQQFQTPDSARIYDNYVRSLFSDQPQTMTPGATPAATPVTRAPQPQMQAPMTPMNQSASRLDDARSARMGTGSNQTMGAARSLFDAVVPEKDAMGTPLRRLGRQQRPENDGDENL